MRKILVIDDEEEFRLLVCHALSTQGHQMLAAPDGQSGIQMAREQSPDLIISDVNMDGTDGYAVLTAIREDPATATIPFIMMTAEADREGMRMGMELGADDYLPKPFSLEGLFTAVATRFKKQTMLRQQADKKLAELRASISMMLPHELNTPLVGIVTSGELLVNYAGDLPPADLKEMGTMLVTAAKRLQRLIQNFLLYARLELLSTNQLEFESLASALPLEAAETVAEAAAKEGAAAGRRADLQLDLAPGIVAIQRMFLVKIVEELVGNAFKFSPAGSPVRVVAVNRGQEWSLSVHNEGRGMTPEQIAQIGAYVQFERRFYEQQGSGLGLILTKRLTELHQGAFSITSEAPQGTTVTVRFPVANPP